MRMLLNFLRIGREEFLASFKNLEKNYGFYTFWANRQKSAKIYIEKEIWL